MKLYTEEQLERAIDLAKRNVSKNRIVESFTPIQIPSDEEIEEIAMAVYGFKATSVKEVLEYKAFKRGARLIMNKIKGGNK